MERVGHRKASAESPDDSIDTQGVVDEVRGERTGHGAVGGIVGENNAKEVRVKVEDRVSNNT